jgi:beta-aspartyl-peptidase (threonine type)
MSWRRRNFLQTALGAAGWLAAMPRKSGAADSSPGTPPGPAVMVHGGASSPVSRSVHVAPAAEAAWKVLQEGGTALDAAIAAAVVLEDDPRFNAGTGSNIRMDGETVQMDAAVMDQTGEFGAVAVIERVKNPVLVAREVMKSPHLLLAGEGATRFARTLGMEDYDPRTPESMERYRQLLFRMRNSSMEDGWKDFDWRSHWNFPTELQDVLKAKDTIGAVVGDGKGGYGVAVSTGGTSTTLYGRVGDVPLLGAGCYAGPAGAVCATGEGEHIIREHLCQRIYELMVQGATPEDAIKQGLALFPKEISIGLIAVSRHGIAADSNTQMAWAGMIGDQLLRADTSARS